MKLGRSAEIHIFFEKGGVYWKKFSARRKREGKTPGAVVDRVISPVCG